MFRGIGLRVLVCLFFLTAAASARAGGVAEALRTFEAAKVVIGQKNFTGGDCNQVTETAAANTLCAGEGAPALGKKQLYIPDLHNDRVLGFKKIPKRNDASAKFVLGQTNFSNTSPGTSSTSFDLPTRVATAGSKLFVVDFGNSRVLIWNKLPTKTNTPANVVVGQPNFTSATGTTSQSGLDGPDAAAVAGGKLFISDHANNRVLIWNHIPTTDGANADVVVGQSDFTSSGHATSQTGLDGPTGLWSDGTRLVVSDFFNNRVLIWKSIPTANDAPADLVVGQPDFNSSGVSATTAQSLEEPGDVTSDGTRLFVADARENRVLVYSPFPTSNGPAANIVLGQSDFTHGEQNAGNPMPSAQTLNDPFGVSVIGKQLFVDDNGNSRVLIFGL
jgi:hypothetical protein